MKKLRPTRWFGSSYIYSWQSGIAKHRSGAAFLYLLAVALPTVGAIFLASVQLKGQAHPASSNLSSSSTIKKPNSQAQLPAANAAAVNYRDAQLDAIVSAFISAHPGHQWSVSVQGLGIDGRSSTTNANLSYNAASLYKLLLMYPLAQKLPYDQWGSKDLTVNDKSVSVADCVTAMLKVSDNDCGDAVGNFVGWGYAETQLHSIGLGDTHLNNSQGPTATAANVAYFLQELYGGKLMDDAATSFVIDNLQEQIYRSGIPAGCGAECTVADKIGDLSTVRHDAGIVQYQNGAYVLTIMTDGASYAQIAQLTSQIQAHMSAQN